MNTAKKGRITAVALIAMLCLMAGIALGRGWTFAQAENGSESASTPPSVYTAEINAENTGFGAASAVDWWSDEFDWQLMGIGGGATLNINFTQPIDATQYYCAAFRALNWNNYGTPTIDVELLNSDGNVVETVALRAHTSGVANDRKDVSYFVIDLDKYKNAENKVSGIKMRVPSNFGEHLIISNFTCYCDKIAVLNAAESGMKNAAIAPGAGLNWASLFSAQSEQNPNAMSQTVKFIKPITVDAEHKYAIFNAMFWDGSSWIKTAVKGNGNASASENLYILQGGAGDMTAENVKVVLPLENLANGDGKIENITFEYAGIASWSGIFIISDFQIVASLPADIAYEAGDINYKVSGIQKANTLNWASVFDYEILNVANNEFELTFYEAIDTGKYYAAEFDILAWASGDKHLNAKKSDGTQQDTFTVRGHGDKDALDQRSKIALRLSDYAIGGKVESIKLQFTDMAASDEHVMFTDFTCYEIPTAPAGKISAPLSKLYPVHTVSAWAERFDFESKQDTSPKSFTVEFINPIQITHKYAVLSAMFWGGSAWKNVTVTANGNGDVSEKVWVVQGYEDGYGNEKVLLPLEKFKSGDGMLNSITLSCDTLGSDSYQGFLLISELEFTDEPPADLVIEQGDIDYRVSGLNKANTVPEWKNEFDYEKMNVQSSNITIAFYEPIDTDKYKYAEFNMLLWVHTGWYDIGVSANGKSGTLLVPAYESVGVIDSKCGLRLSDYADSDGMIKSITFKIGELYNAAGESANGHLLITDFTLFLTAPPEEIPKAGDIDYKRSGLIKTSANSPVAFWGDVFDYQAPIKKNDKLKIIFAEPIDAADCAYAVFNALLWGIPDFIDVPVTTPDGSATLSVYSYWADTAGEINASNMLARLELKQLANSDGKINELTFDFKNVYEDASEFAGWFLFENFNCVNMEVNQPANKKDISAIMPIGAGKTFAAAAGGEDGSWNKQASARTEAYDAVEFNLKATYSEHFKFGILARTLRPSDSVGKSGRFGGVLIELTDTYASVGVWNGDELITSRKQGNFFDSGDSVKVKLEIAETTLLQTPCGYTLRLTVGDEALEDLYFDTGAVTLGYYTHVLTANGKEFEVLLETATQTPVSAQDFMNVQLVAASNDGATKRVPLKFLYNDICNTQISAPEVSGAAHWDSTGGYLVFDGEGEVTVKYSVKNDFGTFESNTLTLAYAAPAQKTEVPQKKSGCGGAIGLGSLCAAVALIAACAIVLRIRKKEFKNGDKL